MEIITIAPDGVNRIIVHSGKLPRAKLAWESRQIQIYLLHINAKNWHTAANIAMNHALSLHIPIKSLRRAGK